MFRFLLVVEEGREEQEVVHIFVVCGCQISETDSWLLALTSKLIAAAVVQVGICCTGNSVTVSGDPNVDPKRKSRDLSQQDQPCHFPRLCIWCPALFGSNGYWCV